MRQYDAPEPPRAYYRRGSRFPTTHAPESRWTYALASAFRAWPRLGARAARVARRN